MTEQEWLSSADPFPLIEFLQGKVSDRKLRLFAVACCRLVWHQMEDDRSKNAVEVAERFADGRASITELTDARDAAPSSYRTWLSTGLPYHDELAQSAAVLCARESVDAEAVLQDAFLWADMTPNEDGDELAASILRDIFGNPFRPVSIFPNWITSNVLALAGEIYDSGECTRLPMLVDALEAAGCESADILNHCRGEGQHVRGCWVVDSILGRS
jgi:hypothetical protein